MWQKAVVLAVGDQKPEKPLEKAQIIYVRHSSVQPDYDNMVASFKAIQDGLKTAGVIIDDKHSVVGVPKYLWEKAPRGGGFVTIEVSGGIVTDDACAQG